MRLSRKAAEAARAARVHSTEESIESFIGEPTRRKKGPRSTAPKQLEELVLEAERRAKEGDWDEAPPRLLVALYVWCHRRIYKVDPGIRGKEFTIAGFRAASFVRDELGGDLPLAVDFIRWTWTREAKHERTRRAGDDFRVSWKYQFSTKLLVSFRIERRRAGVAAASG